MLAPIPPLLSDRPFTRQVALAAGITDTMLRGKRFRRLFRGVYVDAAVELTLHVWLIGALLAMPPRSVVSHVTALRWYGFDIGSPWPLHLSTRTATHTRQAGIAAHQRRAVISVDIRDGIPVTRPDRTLVDIATKVTLVELIQAAEWMIHRRLTTVDTLGTYAMHRSLDGVRRVRRVIGLVREGAESPMETLVRLMLVFARLPEPACNVDIRDSLGRFIARGDLVYAQFLVVVEYDGWHHERDGRQRRHDLLRRERLETAGWRVIVITADDLQHKRAVVHRVHAALSARGYGGPSPTFNIMWDRWFA